MKNLHKTIENNISVVTETKLKLNSGRKPVTVKKTTKSSVKEL